MWSKKGNYYSPLYKLGRRVLSTLKSRKVDGVHKCMVKEITPFYFIENNIEVTPELDNY